jgi:hypothetical protein
LVWVAYLPSIICHLSFDFAYNQQISILDIYLKLLWDWLSFSKRIFFGNTGVY